MGIGIMGILGRIGKRSGMGIRGKLEEEKKEGCYNPKGPATLDERGGSFRLIRGFSVFWGDGVCRDAYWAFL